MNLVKKSCIAMGKVEQIQFEILSTLLLTEYNQKVSKTLRQDFQSLSDSELSIDTFSLYTSVAVVYSSKIEGENIEENRMH